jgi:hypothetical protein
MIVTNHARHRFRSRYMRQDEVNEIGDQVTDDWLRGLVRLALQAGDYEDVIDDQRPMRVVELASRCDRGQPLYACLRDSDTIVSLLEKWQRDNNRRSSWLNLHGEPFVFSATLGERLAR